MSAIEIYTELKNIIKDKDNKDVFIAMNFLQQEVQNEYYRAQEKALYPSPVVNSGLCGQG